MANSPAVSVLSPHTDGPRKPGATPMAAHTLRTSPGRCTCHCSVGARRQTEVANPPRSAGYRTRGYYVADDGQTPQPHTRSPCVPRETPELARGLGKANHQMNYVPPKKGVPAPAPTQIPCARAPREQRLCADERSSDRGHLPRHRRLRRPETQTSHHRAMGHHIERSTYPGLSTNNTMPSTLARQLKYHQFRECLRSAGPTPDTAEQLLPGTVGA